MTEPLRAAIVGAGPSGFYLAYLRDPDGNKICAMHRTKAPAQS